jgi:hypothetical protein
MYMILNLDELAYRCSKLRGRLAYSALDDWLVARHLRHQVIKEAAYFRWLNRSRPIGDPWADWFASEAEVASTRQVQDYLTDSFVDERLRHHVIEQAAYFRWLNRGRPIGDPQADWFVSEAEVVNDG